MTFEAKHSWDQREGNNATAKDCQSLLVMHVTFCNTFLQTCRSRDLIHTFMSAGEVGSVKTADLNSSQAECPQVKTHFATPMHGSSDFRIPGGNGNRSRQPSWHEKFEFWTRTPGRTISDASPTGSLAKVSWRVQVQAEAAQRTPIAVQGFFWRRSVASCVG